MVGRGDYRVWKAIPFLRFIVVQCFFLLPFKLCADFSVAHKNKKSKHFKSGLLVRLRGLWQLPPPAVECTLSSHKFWHTVCMVVPKKKIEALRAIKGLWSRGRKGSPWREPAPFFHATLSFHGRLPNLYLIVIKCTIFVIFCTVKISRREFIMPSGQRGLPHAQ
jgi:hypothetical protein